MSPDAAGDDGSLDRTAAVAARPFRVESVAWDDARAADLRTRMDAELGPRYADRPRTPGRRAGQQVDPADVIFTGLVVDERGTVLAHAALRYLGDEIEVKRVFTIPVARGTGVSILLMTTLEDVARAHGAHRLILQTGDRQPEAVALYRKLGYEPIPIYPPYTSNPASLCFAKPLAAVDAGVGRAHQG